MEIIENQQTTFNLPPFLQNKLNNKKQLTKEELEEKLSRAEAARLNNIDAKVSKADHTER